MAAHPRVSGENWGVALIEVMRPGSSPRERGKLYARVSRQEQGRLIPA